MNIALFILHFMAAFLFFLLVLWTGLVIYKTFRMSFVGDAIRFSMLAFLTVRIGEVITFAMVLLYNDYQGELNAARAFLGVATAGPFYTVVLQVVFQWVDINLMVSGVLRKRGCVATNVVLCSAANIFNLLSAIAAYLFFKGTIGSSSANIVTYLSAIYYIIFIGTFIAIIITFIIYGRKLAALIKTLIPLKSDSVNSSDASQQTTAMIVVIVICWLLKIIYIIWQAMDLQKGIAPDSDGSRYRQVFIQYLPEIATCAFIHLLYRRMTSKRDDRRQSEASDTTAQTRDVSLQERSV